MSTHFQEYIFTVIFLLLFSISGQAQEKYALKISTTPDEEYIEKTFASELKREQYLKQHLLNLFQQGYIAASIDSISSIQLTDHVYLTKGNLYKYLKILPGNVDQKLLRRLAFRNRTFENKPLNPLKISRLFEDILTYLENNGYPFASLKLNDIKLTELGVVGTLALTKSALTRIDSIVFKGDSEIPQHILIKQIGIAPGDLYDQKLLNNISIKIDQVPYLQEIKPYEILFTEKKTILYLYLKKKKSNSFNGMLGILPNEESEKINFTGELNAQLKNSIKKGETFIFNWRKLINETQNLHLGIDYPYVFKSPLSTELNFKLYKKDTTFLAVTQELMFKLHQNNNDYLSLNLQLYNTSLLNATNVITSESNVLEWADIQMFSYGLGYTRNKLNYTPNPTKGYSFKFLFKTGKKKIKENAELLKINPTIYKELNLNSNQYALDFYGELYLPYLKFFSLKTALYSAKIFNKNIFFNEMYRIGGLKTLRGFDEESIFASTFSIVTFENRFILEKNSAIFAFTDIGYYESILENDLSTSKPIGIGMGIDFETKAGVFSFIYALGKQFNNPFMLRSGKIHFGIKSTF